ncbi:MAG: nucleotidyltransferase domain-containing protein [Candidatus Eremiobacterota bacterium]
MAERTLYLARHGSHAYGTARDGSDLDLRGFCVPPRAYLMGFARRFEQAEQRGNPDVVVFSLPKFMQLSVECNPNALEVLFVDPSDRLILTPLGKRILEHRESFLSRKARYTFVGYAMSQLKRIETHRRWLLQPPTHQPQREEFDLPPRTVIPADQLAAAESMIRRKVDAWQLDLTGLEEAQKLQLEEHLVGCLSELHAASTLERMDAAGRILGFSENFLRLLDRERRYSQALKEWQQYRSWVDTRNPDRAALEARYGYDCKHGMHLVRLLRMGREILTEGVMRVRRPDADELLAIRDGQWPFDRLIEWAHREAEALAALATRSPLPPEPDREALDRLCVEVVEAAL